VIRSGTTDLHVITLECLLCQDKKQTEGVEAEIKDEVLSQLSIHTINEIFARAFVMRLAGGKVNQN
jgi:hypothetical protein